MTKEEFGATMMCVGFTADQFELVCSYTDKLEAELKAKDEEIENLKTTMQNMCAECACAKFADNAIKPSEMWKLHTILKDNK